MSFMDFILGGKNSSGSQNTDSKQTTNSTTNLDSTTKSSSGQTGNVAALDPQTLATLQGALGSVASGIKSGSEIDAAIKASQAEAQRGFDVDTMQKINQAAQKIGSSDNTIPLMLQNKAREDLAIQLNAISKNTILGQSNTSAQLLASLGSVIKGGNVSSTQSTNTESTTNAVQKLLQEIVGNQDTTTRGHTDPTLASFAQGLGAVAAIGAA